MDDFAGFWSGGILGGDAPRRPYVAMLGMGMDGCAGGVAPLRPYDMVGRGFRCFACASMTAPFLSPATAHDGAAIIWPGANSGSQEAGGYSLPACGLALPISAWGIAEHAVHQLPGCRSAAGAVRELPLRAVG